MPKSKNPLSDPTRLAPATQLVHGGGARSPHGETAEALYLSSGYTYPDSAHAEQLFKGEISGHNYSRFSNPTIDMFQHRMALLEGAEAARAFARGLGSVPRALRSGLWACDRCGSTWGRFGGCGALVEDFTARWGGEAAVVAGRVPNSL